jgi:AcrR family transcriptional regulator
LLLYKFGESNLLKRTKKKNSGSNKKSGPLKRGKEETREQLLAAALELFAQKGYRGTSVRDLAAAAGVTTGAFYSNFRSKRDIYVAVTDRITTTIQEIVDELTKEIIEILKQRSSVKIARMEYDLISKPIQRLFDEASRHEALLNILIREGLGRDPDFQREIDRVWERFVQVAKRALDTYILAGFAKPYDTELVARAMVPMSIAMGLYDVKTKGERRQDIVVLIASMLHGGASQWVSWREYEKEV